MSFLSSYQGRIYIPGRYSSEDLAQQADYNRQIENYNTAYDQYKADVDSYNQRLEAWNRGPRTTPFGGVEPNAPTAPGFTQADIDQFNEQASQRARQRQSTINTALTAVRDPDRFNFGSFGFADGGNPVAEGVGSLYSFAEDGSMSGPNADSMRYATAEEVDIGSYKHLQDLQDKFNYHMEAAQSPVTMIGGVAPAQADPNVRIAHAKDAEMYRDMIEDFKDKRARAIVNYEDYLKAGGLPLYVNTEKGAYFSGFPDALVNFREAKP